MERFRSSGGFVAGAGKRVLRIDRGAGHCSRNRTHTEKEWDRSDADRFIPSRSGGNEMVAWSKSTWGASQFLESLYLGNLVVVKGEHKLL